MGNVHWGAVLLGYLVGSFFSLFQLWAWAKNMIGGPRTKLAPAS